MRPLKLAALDGDDLGIISAHVQDALVAIDDLRYLAREKRFVVALKRFAWEKASAGGREPDERRVSILKFDRILSVKSRGIARARQGTPLVLLSIAFDPAQEPAGTIRLIFAGNGEIALEAECIEAALADTGAAWQAGKRPDHGGDPASAGD
jgi:hypothetical protein